MLINGHFILVTYIVKNLQHSPPQRSLTYFSSTVQFEYEFVSRMLWKVLSGSVIRYVIPAMQQRAKDD